MSEERKKIFFFINDLRTGGAQNTLKRVLYNLRERHDITICVFLSLGPVGVKLQEEGFEIKVFDKWGLMQIPGTLQKIYRLIRMKKPDFIFTFLYFSDMIGGILGKIASRKTKVTWNVRNDLMMWGDTGTMTFFISRINTILSYIIPDKIIYCSAPSAIAHTKLGYQAKKAIVCENNIDTSLYAFDHDARTALRASLSVNDETPVFCMACRYDKIKNIPLYLESIACYYKKYAGFVLFLLCGEGIDENNIELHAEIKRTGVGKYLILKNYIDNMPRFLSAVDCVVVTSKSEGSPNIIYEGIASGTNCIVSNIQLSKERINEKVKIVDSFDACSFADSFNAFATRFSEYYRDRIKQGEKRRGKEVYVHNLSSQIKSIIA